MKNLLALFLLFLGGLAAAAQASELAACEASAAEKKLAGASRDSFVKKCVDDFKAAAKASAKPPPAASANPSACQSSASPVGCPPVTPRK